MSALVTQHLPLLAGAPDGIRKLRELILELAVRGKLVPQDPRDEPASGLLKRIAKEKAWLVAERGIGKQKPLAEISFDEVPFHLPVNWEWVRLGEITNFGITAKDNRIPDDAWVLDLEDVEKNSSRLIRKVYFSERRSLSDKNVFFKGDVLYGKLRPYLNKVLVADDDGFCTTEILPFRCYGPFDPHYFKIALKSPYFLAYVNSRSYGMKMPRLGTEDGRQAQFPLPPLFEQHRIVAKVDELMALCDTLEAQQADAESAHARLVQALLDSLTQASDAQDFANHWQRLSAHFDTLFTTESSIDALKQAILQLAVMGKLVPQDPSDEPASELLRRISTEKIQRVNNGKSKKPKPDGNVEAEVNYVIPSSWASASLGDVTEIVRGITFPASEKSKEPESGRVACLRTSNVQDKIEWDDLLYIREDFVARSDQYVEPHDIVMSMANSRELVGKVALVGAELKQKTTFGGFLGVIRPILIKPKFVMALLRTPGARGSLIDSASQTTNIANISLGKLRPLPFAIPPLAEQHRIVDKVDELMALCDQLKSRLRQARDLNQQLATTLFERAIE